MMSAARRLVQIGDHVVRTSPAAAVEQTGAPRRVLAAEAGDTLASFSPSGELEWAPGLTAC
jgi:hypothetical protein